jgi:dinuclear metal center YbgI/SA1388 family protein
MPTVKDVAAFLESFAPLSLQESYDNAGLIVGNPTMEVTGITICLDSTEEVILDAKKNGCNLVIAHHPIVFSGLKKLNGKNYIERTVIRAIKDDVAIYAAHTNVDNIIDGVNRVIAEKLGLTNLRVLSPKRQLLRKLTTFCPVSHLENLRQALFSAGAGQIGNYDQCSFSVDGVGTFRGNELSDPFLGKKGELSKEMESRLEVVFPADNQSSIIKALKNNHPYEEVAYYLHVLENEFQDVGSGIIGELVENQPENDFLGHVKSVMKAGVVRHTSLLGKKVKAVAICGGSGSFLLNDAIRAGADVFITADFKYHQFFDADGKIVIADIGHFESEQYTMDLFKSLILKNFSTFAVRLTEVSTNPVHYL